MHNETTSRHIRSSTELMIMVPIKNAFVPITDLVMTYASRISLVLAALAELRQTKVERGFGDPVGPIERLHTIYRVQWTVLEPFDDVGARSAAVTRQLRAPQVVLTSHFDSSWEDYFYELVGVGAPLLDLIFSHCEGYEGSSCKDGYEAFSAFIRRHQRRCDFLYTTAPDVMIEDVRYLKRLSTSLGRPADELKRMKLVPFEQEVQAIIAPFRKSAAADRAECAAAAQDQRPPRPSAGDHDEATRSALRAVHGLYDIGKRLFQDGPALTVGAEVYSDARLFEDAVGSVLELEPDFYRLGAALAARETRRELPPRELGAAASWAVQVVQNRQKTPPAPAPSLSREDVERVLSDAQGNTLSGYANVTGGKLLLMRCHDRAALRSLLELGRAEVTSEADSRAYCADKRVYTNLGLTHYGLQLLGLPDAVMEWFPREFREGMEERAGVLGDVEYNHPKQWLTPRLCDATERIHLCTVHVALVLSGDKSLLEDKVALWRTRAEILHVLDLTPSAAGELSQPGPGAELRRKDTAQPAKRDELPLGELLLGYDNRDGRKSSSADDERNPYSGLFKNGTFMAMRKMQQDEAALTRYVERMAHLVCEDKAKWPAELDNDLRALIIGRRPDGRMLGQLQPRASAPSNEFDFSADPEGAMCPLHSHVRRSNPRRGDSPRIVRRAMSYGPQREEQGESGLLFMAYCASLAGQYEIVQRWVNGGTSTGLMSRQNDLLCGAPMHDDVPRVVSLAHTCAAQIPGAPESIELPPRTQPFVRLRWGLYLFMPSLTAIDQLCTSDYQAKDEAPVARGRERIKELAQLPAALRMHEWKRLLEEVPEADSPQARQAQDVAAAITAAGGALLVEGDGAARENTWVVVTTADHAENVLRNDAAFSVREYRVRFNAALADHYLGYDLTTTDEPTGFTYEQLATYANQEIARLGSRAQSDTVEVAHKLLRQPDMLELDPDGANPDGPRRSTVSVKDFATAVVGELCHKWLDMPGVSGEDSVRARMDAVERLLVASRYCFQTAPVGYLADKARSNRTDINADYGSGPRASALASASQALFSGSRPSGKGLASASGTTSVLAQPQVERLTKTALMGAVGFAPPAIGAVTRILDYWMESGQLWQLQRAVAADPKVLRPAILEALSKVPAPPTLYRTATQRSTLGTVTVPEGARVIVNLAAVYGHAVERKDDSPEAWFFGGKHGGARAAEGTTRHGCPGRAAGVIVIEEIVRALLQQKNLRRERRMLLSYDGEA